jgi:hypothetical protein
VAKDVPRPDDAVPAAAPDVAAVELVSNDQAATTTPGQPVDVHASPAWE